MYLLAIDKIITTLIMLSATKWLLTDSVDQDLIAQNVQSDLGSTLSDEEIFNSLNNYEIAKFSFFLSARNFNPLTNMPILGFSNSAANTIRCQKY